MKEVSEENYKQIKEEFESRVNELGLAAVDERINDPGRKFALTKLIEYFKRNMFEYFLAANCISTRDYSKYTPGVRDGLLEYKKYERASVVDSTIGYLIDDGKNGLPVFSDLLTRKVERYDPEKIVSDKNSFWAYVYRDIAEGQDDKAREYKNAAIHGGMTEVINSTQKRVIGYIYKLKNSVDVSDYNAILYNAAKKFRMNLEDVQKILYQYEEAVCLSTDYESENSDGEKTPGFDIEDKTVQTEFNNIFSQLSVDEVFFEKLHRICDENLSEDHQKVFAALCTNDGLIRSYFANSKRPSDSWQDVVEREWETVNLPDYRDYFLQRQYNFIAIWVFDKVIEKRRILTDYYISAQLGIAPSTYAKRIEKIVDDLRPIVMSKK